MEHISKTIGEIMKQWTTPDNDDETQALLHAHSRLVMIHLIMLHLFKMPIHDLVVLKEELDGKYK